eukprot:symbB.v1.2.006731.t1/scaffold406.1/size210851/1
MEREAVQGECTFNPDTSRSSRSFQQIRSGMIARTPEKADSARGLSKQEPSFTPTTNPVPARMRSAQAYLQQSVFRRLAEPITPRARRHSTAEVSYASTPRRLRTLRGSPLSRCSSAPTVGSDGSNFVHFLQRQNLCEEVRLNRLGDLEAAVAPALRPVLCERSLQLAIKGRERQTPSPCRNRARSPAEKECRFTPKITTLARRSLLSVRGPQRDPRGSEQLGPMDQRRREERARRRLEEKARKEAKVSSGYFKPSVNSYQNVGSRLRILEEPDTYLDRVSRTRARALEVIRNQCKEEFPFQPKAVQPAPSLVQRMARSHRAVKEMREKENRTKAGRPAWQASTLLN